jgi:hypothetical protein
MLAEAIAKRRYMLLLVVLVGFALLQTVESSDPPEYSVAKSAKLYALAQAQPWVAGDGWFDDTATPTIRAYTASLPAALVDEITLWATQADLWQAVEELLLTPSLAN